MKRKYFTYLFIVLGFIACSNDEVIDSPQEEQEEINLMNAYIPLRERSKQEKKDLLGKGYDFTGSFISYKSAREQVIDMTKFNAENGGRIYCNSTTESSNYNASGSTAWKYSKSLTSKSYGTYTGSLADDIAAFTGTYLDNEYLNNEKNDTTTYSFASVHFYFILKQFKIEIDRETLRLYLTETFRNDLEKLSAEQIIKKYGTHVIYDYSIGCRLDLVYRSKITVEPHDYDYRITKIVESGLRHTVNKMSYWINGSIAPLEDSDVKKNKTPILYVENQGGDNNLISSGTYNLQKQYPDINISTWVKSLSEDNAALVDLELSRLIPIHDLIIDEQKRFEIKNAIEKYIIRRQK